MRATLGLLFLLSFTLVSRCDAFQLSLGKLNDTVRVNTNLDAPPRWGDMFVNIPRDWVRWSQISFRHNTIGMWVAVTSSTALLIATDEKTYEPSKKFYDSDPAKAFYSNLFAELGDGRSQFGLSAAFALYGWAAKDAKALKVASQIAEVVLASGTVVQVLKHSTGRESPIVRSSPTGTWRFLPSPIEYHRRIPAYDAYPSGHVATSLATIIVLSENYPDVKWIRPLGYTLVAGVAVGMVNNGIHWYSDYPLSIALGYYFGMIATHPEGFGSEDDDRTVQMSLIPIFRPEGGGLSLMITF